MKIKMLKNARHSPDNRQVLHYEAGKTYDVAKETADQLINANVAELEEGEGCPLIPKPRTVKATKGS